jgi:hypothetical protein
MSSAAGDAGEGDADGGTAGDDDRRRGHAHRRHGRAAKGVKATAPPLPPHCRMTLAVIEQVVGEPYDPVPLRGLLDLQMRVLTRGGRERTAREWAALLRRGGFVLIRIYPTRSLLSVIEAAPSSDAAAL